MNKKRNTLKQAPKEELRELSVNEMGTIAGGGFWELLTRMRRRAEENNREQPLPRSRVY